MQDRTYVITGLPRSGTTYLAALLHRPPDSVTISDPFGYWRNYYAQFGAGSEVLREFKVWRQRITEGNDVPVLGQDAFWGTPKRVDTWSLAKEQRPVRVTPGFFLGMKNPEIFLAMLPVFIKSGLKVLVSVRDPVAVINSWVNAAPPGARDFANGCCDFYASEHPDPAMRRIELYQYLANLLLPNINDPDVCVVKHEAWYNNGLAQLTSITDFLGMPELPKLRPSPTLPLTITLPESEVTLIRKKCAPFTTE